MPLLRLEKATAFRVFLPRHSPLYEKCTRFLVWALALITYLCAGMLQAQDTAKVVLNGTDGLLYTLPPPDPAAKALPANEFNGRFTTIKLGMGFIYDAVAYKQSNEFKRQMDSADLDVYARGKTRDFRLLGSGVLRTKRPISWKFAYMYDGDKNVWMLRETGITIGVPELFGNIFIGRTKEGFSMVKVMNGHSPWTNERQMALDPIPILADGIKWMGFLPKPGIFWNLGAYTNVASKTQTFATFSSQYVARIGWLPVNNAKTLQVFHIAVNLRYGKPKN